MLTADHAGRAIPRALGSLGLPESELERHIAWDIGIAAVSERLADRLGAFLIMQSYSRLVIDCNRSPDAPSSILTESEYTVVPGNQSLELADIEARRREVFEPYHTRLVEELDRRDRAGVPTVYVAMHSFTPRFKGVDRPWECGVLYHRDARLARRVLELLRAEGLEVGDNQPYFVSDATDYGVPVYAERRGYLHVELELRQDLIASAEGQERWAALLERVFRRAAAEVSGGRDG